MALKTSNKNRKKDIKAPIASPTVGTPPTTLKFSDIKWVALGGVVAIFLFLLI